MSTVSEGSSDEDGCEVSPAAPVLEPWIEETALQMMSGKGSRNDPKTVQVLSFGTAGMSQKSSWPNSGHLPPKKGSMDESWPQLQLCDGNVSITAFVVGDEARISLFGSAELGAKPDENCPETIHPGSLCLIHDWDFHLDYKQQHSVYSGYQPKLTLPSLTIIVTGKIEKIENIRQVKNVNKSRSFAQALYKYAYNQEEPLEKIFPLEHTVSKLHQLGAKKVVSTLQSNLTVSASNCSDPGRDQKRKLVKKEESSECRQQAYFQEKYEALKKFKSLHGHCRVPTREESIGWWAQNIRRDNGVRLNSEQRKKMVEIGFCWDVKEYHWMTHFDALKEFYTTNGHCQVPCNYPKDIQLNQWLQRQRARYREGKMPYEQVESLNKLCHGLLSK